MGVKWTEYYGFVTRDSAWLGQRDPSEQTRENWLKQTINSKDGTGSGA